MKTANQIIAETVNRPKSPDERRFIAKHRAVFTDHPVSTRSQKDGGQISKDRTRKADRESPEDEIVYEMSDARMKKREKIVKSMKKKQSDFKGRYGDDWKKVMYATANRMAMKESFLFEANLSPEMELKDGSKVNLTKEDIDALSNLFSDLKSSNRKRMESRMMESKKGFEEILQFAKEVI